MAKYVPFLKLKANEIQALEKLIFDFSGNLRPFFDIPRISKGGGEQAVRNKLTVGYKQLKKLLDKRGPFDFYIDNFDLDDDVTLGGKGQYHFILESFKEFKPIPVLALDRNLEHNEACFGYLREVGGKVAIRLQLEDIESYALTKPKLIALWKEIKESGAEGVHLVIDTRVIAKDDFAMKAATVSEFLSKSQKDFKTESTIVSGSTIPANISALLATNSSVSTIRYEYKLWLEVKQQVPLINVAFGDYGVVSPDYSDAELSPKLFGKISTPKVFYPYSDKFFVIRGSAFQSHPDGYGQYYSVADSIMSQSFFRGKDYSYGESYIFERSSQSSKRPPKGGAPGSWIKSTLAAHITFIVNSI